MRIEKPKEFRIKHPRVHLTSLTLVIIFIIFYIIGWSITSIQVGNYEKKRAKQIAEIISYCEDLFEESSAIKDNTTRKELEKCSNRLTEIKEYNEKAEILKTQISDATYYLDLKDKISEWFDEDGAVKESLDEQSLISIHESSEKLSEPYKAKIAEKRNQLQSEYDKMRIAEKLVNELFTSVDRIDVNPNATRDAYNNAKNHTNELRQEGIKGDLNKSLEKVLSSIEEKERIAREQAEAARRAREEEQRKINSSWHVLDISPWYINQYNAGLYNGCEAASLLMAAKFKGYARGADYRSFALGMPTSDNPNSGFYLSMENLEPREEAHWIAPAPLAQYGKSKGINSINISGRNLDQLDQEVANGNPVVIYLTYNFNEPKQYSKGVPKNLHVLVLAGFNSYTGEQILYDPWPKYSGAKQTLSKNRTNYLYNASGKRAVVIK